MVDFLGLFSSFLFVFEYNGLFFRITRELWSWGQHRLMGLEDPDLYHGRFLFNGY